MLVLEGERISCESCIRGHRSSTCLHINKWLYSINWRGRPENSSENIRFRIPPGCIVIATGSVRLEPKPGSKSTSGRVVPAKFLHPASPYTFAHVNSKGGFALISYEPIWRGSGINNADKPKTPDQHWVSVKRDDLVPPKILCKDLLVRDGIGYQLNTVYEPPQCISIERTSINTHYKCKIVDFHEVPFTLNNNGAQPSLRRVQPSVETKDTTQLQLAFQPPAQAVGVSQIHQPLDETNNDTQNTFNQVFDEDLILYNSLMNAASIVDFSGEHEHSAFPIESSAPLLAKGFESINDSCFTAEGTIDPRTLNKTQKPTELSLSNDCLSWPMQENLVNDPSSERSEVPDISTNGFASTEFMPEVFNWLQNTPQTVVPPNTVVNDFNVDHLFDFENAALLNTSSYACINKSVDHSEGDSTLLEECATDNNEFQEDGNKETQAAEHYYADGHFDLDDELTDCNNESEAIPRYRLARKQADALLQNHDGEPSDQTLTELSTEEELEPINDKSEGNENFGSDGEEDDYNEPTNAEWIASDVEDAKQMPGHNDKFSLRMDVDSAEGNSDNVASEESTTCTDLTDPESQFASPKSETRAHHRHQVPADLSSEWFESEQDGLLGSLLRSNVPIFHSLLCSPHHEGESAESF
ncbi:copper fist DNA-binding domain-containing protein CYBJADRAFT_160069 [Cyberlindnera jadinii NRRL Y-1542]|uniref:Copper-fist domain-containing protein n=1 Tax=Cyberlindnera jadinii (strain ATCC 18201 / CBS 1600 / BCRC 20928 / JCM 3617 / NBRC 0987 / NRRL Y-1542) TaxID=983966 RepID=A0A1E4S9K7_CYBJN|nr:hypothetical protein CYBJADRAFT_160069 [Cyberlindnera jadinii NRRL Y-1542]ODV76072.1 hypothetical protein CYBJADRAFT_160069 [Cyberlindnera jadinii NRRL Y-1542]